MDIGVQSSSQASPSPETVAVRGGVVIDFPVDKESFSSPRRIPRNLQKRLLEAKAPASCSVEDIEAKLRHAHLRRQVLYYYYSTFAVSYHDQRENEDELSVFFLLKFQNFLLLNFCRFFS
ncbi:hypothetical protein OIU79_011113 [Salix purpurea]|uniref:Uncharacterized protein n=1 Tax=Salix purpurea TaxID=77065 RepID=A0A9Q0QH77_SALPP|nr:hypothetical protein OIU79_011113 [Salix purpurea]